jgi:ABC-type transporter Mla subunit MlaD
METRFTILLVELGILVAVQAAVLISLYQMMKKSSEKVTSLAEELHRRTLPILDAAGSLVQNTRPQVESIVSNLAETSERLKSQVERIDSTVTEIVDRTRLQVVRADELVSRTIDRVETTSEMVQHTVISPVRQVAGVLQGLSTAMNVLFGRRAAQPHGGNGVGIPRDEMFI